ncbi:FHA domain-containing protein [Homoserinimonas sp. OAct 916]|uniref:FHA domain-containing protein n=1 Tax=Homoserinimonas sp. OAct 916 TaxID=2211450 RepID=UPI001E3C560E|nr:FHA domain-containing protein [Homoserinimonas sp. OAct 916]
MSTSTRLDIDLAFSLTEPNGTPSDPSDAAASVAEQMTGTITASGMDIEIYSTKPELFAQAATVKLKDLRGVAAALAERGLTVSLSGPDGLIARLGAVQAPATQRLLTGSSHIGLGSRTALAPFLRPRRSAATKRSGPLLPPSTLLPLLPTFDRRIRRRITTTHYASGAGRPRLIFVVGSENWNGQKPREFDLLPHVTTIGSSPSADLQLPGLEPLHAEIRHDGNDEYVLYARGEVGGGTQPLAGQEESGRILRTGARMEMGQWRMGFFREEYADHGRPYGGRQGGELSDQKPQPSRRIESPPPAAAPAEAAAPNTDHTPTDEFEI